MNDAANLAVVQTPQPPAPEPEEEEMLAPAFEATRTFKLSVPIERPHPKGVGTETLTHITLRAPLALDVFEIRGGPTRSWWEGGRLFMEWETDRLRQYVVRLSGHDYSIISQMAGRDLKRMYSWLHSELAAAGN
jgi:hypothetical protein